MQAADNPARASCAHPACSLTGGLVAAASRGNDSDVLQLEEEFLIPNGIPPNAVLRRLVETLTDLV